MRLDWYRTLAYGVADEVEETLVFSRGGATGAIVLVENQEEHDLVHALQFIHGSEVNLAIWDKTCITEMRSYHWMIFTSWDPFDPNRI